MLEWPSLVSCMHSVTPDSFEIRTLTLNSYRDAVRECNLRCAFKDPVRIRERENGQVGISTGASTPRRHDANTYPVCVDYSYKYRRCISRSQWDTWRRDISERQSLLQSQPTLGRFSTGFSWYLLFPCKD